MAEGGRQYMIGLSTATSNPGKTTREATEERFVLQKRLAVCQSTLPVYAFSTVAKNVYPAY